MTTNPIPFPHEDTSIPRYVGLSDKEIAGMLRQGVATLQEALDAALLADLVVRPSITLLENRLTPWGMRVDSFVCNVSSFRRLA